VPGEFQPWAGLPETACAAGPAEYEIDLSAANAAVFRPQLAPFMRRGRRLPMVSASSASRISALWCRRRLGVQPMREMRGLRHGPLDRGGTFADGAIRTRCPTAFLRRYPSGHRVRSGGPRCSAGSQHQGHLIGDASEQFRLHAMGQEASATNPPEPGPAHRRVLLDLRAHRTHLRCSEPVANGRTGRVRCPRLQASGGCHALAAAAASKLHLDAESLSPEMSVVRQPGRRASRSSSIDHAP